MSDFFARHPWVLPFVVWPALTGLLNVVFWRRTPEAWVAYAERHPRAAAAIRVLRALGFDPAKAMHALRAVVASRRAQSFPSATITEFPAIPPPPAADDSGAPRAPAEAGR